MIIFNEAQLSRKLQTSKVSMQNFPYAKQSLFKNLFLRSLQQSFAGTKFPKNSSVFDSTRFSSTFLAVTTRLIISSNKVSLESHLHIFRRQFGWKPIFVRFLHQRPENPMNAKWLPIFVQLNIQTAITLLNQVWFSPASSQWKYLDSCKGWFKWIVKSFDICILCVKHLLVQKYQKNLMRVIYPVIGTIFLKHVTVWNLPSTSHFETSNLRSCIRLNFLIFCFETVIVRKL